jgi:hypothetical protein
LIVQKPGVCVLAALIATSVIPAPKVWLIEKKRRRLDYA